jgi:aspartyl protease family protein
MFDKLFDIDWTEQRWPIIALSALMLLIALYSFLNQHGSKIFLTQLLIWCAIIFAIIVLYAFRTELSYITQRIVAVLIPAYSWTNNDKNEIIISRNRDGHFYIDAIINEQKITFMIDTGASDIALTKKDAQTLNLNLARLAYNRKYSTANGIVKVAPVILQNFKIGPMNFNNVAAHISNGDLDVSLLGMSIISRFKSFKIDRDLLIFTGPIQIY